MATKTISLKEEAYNALKRLQLDNESFSDTILRLTDKMGNLSYVFENFPVMDENEASKELANIRKARDNFGESSRRSA